MNGEESKAKEVWDKTLQIIDLLFSIDDFLLEKFFDIESDEMLDDKIEVLTALKNGKNPEDIPKYYDVLELYPRDGYDGATGLYTETMWD